MTDASGLKKIAVITGIFGNYDDVPPVPNGFDDAVLVSDKPIDSNWRNVVIEKVETPRLTSKIPKFRPELFTKCESSVWVDASMRDEKNWLIGAVKEKLAVHDLVFFRHPQRSNVLAELLASLEVDKYLDQPIVEQVHHYQTEGFPDSLGLWAGGVIARNHSPLNAKLGELWMIENRRWSIQDQLSLPYLIWRLNLQVGNFDEDQYAGPLKWIQHKGEYEESILLRKKTKKVLVRRISTLFQLIKARQFNVIWSVIRRPF
jgi:hypothetical protein